MKRGMRMSFSQDSAGLDLSAALPTDSDALKADRDAVFAAQSLLSAEMLASFAQDAMYADRVLHQRIHSGPGLEADM